jgi:PD-(D/E)XK nuclease superfamily
VPRVPTVLLARTITRVTFYQWLALERCAFKGLLAFLELDGSLPDPIPTRASLVGTFYHRAMEVAVTAKTEAEVEQILESEINKLQSTVSRWPHLRRAGSVSGWDEINNAFTLATQMASNRHTVGSVDSVLVEKELCSTNGVLIGRPDYFLVARDRAKLLEYKSSKIRDECGGPSEDHINQLRFYSALIVDSYDVVQIDARIESLSGDSYEVVITRKEAKEFAARVAATIEVVNRSAAQDREFTHLTKPSNENCAFCESRILCAPFKREQDRIGLEGENFVLEGVIKKCDLDSALNIAAVTVADDYRKALVTLMVPTSGCEKIGVGLRTLIVNLRRHGGELAWGHTSRVLSCG